MSRSPGRRRWFRGLVIPALGFLTMLGIAAYLVRDTWFRPEVTHRLTITGGKWPNPRQRSVELLRREASPGLVLMTSEVSGSVEALDRVNGGSVDLAVVQGGLDSSRWTDVTQVAALNLEPLQLVVRGELAGEVDANLRALKGHSINIGEAGSGSNALANEVLAFAGLRGPAGALPGDYSAWTLSHKEVESIADRGRLPDAVMTVSALPTPVVQHLVARWGYRLIPIRFGEAFALEDLNRDLDAPPAGPAGARVRVDKVHLHETYIPEFTYGVEPAVPAEDLPTFGARVLVVAHREVDPGAVQRLLEAIFLGKFAQSTRPPLVASLLDLPPEYPLHRGTLEFLQRNKPLILSDVEFLGNSTIFLGAVLAGFLFVYQIAKRWYRRRRELGFESYLLKVTEIERQALSHELAAYLDLHALVELQAELGRIKNEAIRRFTQGELEGEGLMSGFLTHANDARDYLARLILHARTAIEKRAKKQGLSPEAAWELAIGGSEPAENQERALPIEGELL